MREAITAIVSVAVLLLAVAAGAQQTQNEFKTCTEAFWACRSKTGMQAECETERQWCLRTGTFADPKTRSVSTGLQRK